jgi:hypothetical protein
VGAAAAGGRRGIDEVSPVTAMLPARHRAAFVSDVHLGSRHCHAAELADFLAGLRCAQLYLVGDIVDFWWLAQRRAAWGPAQQCVVEALHVLARAGTPAWRMLAGAGSTASSAATSIVPGCSSAMAWCMPMTATGSRA